jgi:hypothetical protein
MRITNVKYIRQFYKQLGSNKERQLIYENREIKCVIDELTLIHKCCKDCTIIKFDYFIGISALVNNKSILEFDNVDIRDLSRLKMIGFKDNSNIYIETLSINIYGRSIIYNDGKVDWKKFYHIDEDRKKFQRISVKIILDSYKDGKNCNTNNLLLNIYNDYLKEIQLLKYEPVGLFLY